MHAARMWWVVNRHAEKTGLGLHWGWKDFGCRFQVDSLHIHLKAGAQQLGIKCSSGFKLSCLKTPGL